MDRARGIKKKLFFPLFLFFGEISHRRNSFGWKCHRDSRGADHIKFRVDLHRSRVTDDDPQPHDKPAGAAGIDERTSATADRAT